jgi:hypothetical protein
VPDAGCADCASAENGEADGTSAAGGAQIRELIREN